MHKCFDRSVSELIKERHVEFPASGFPRKAQLRKISERNDYFVFLIRDVISYNIRL